MSGGDATPERLEDRLARRGGAIELLRLPSALYAGAMAFRNALYDAGFLGVERLDASVVSVGNLSAGGTGKTPCVALVARELVARGRRPGILSRGYRRGAAERSDEGALLAQRLPDVPHVENADRAAGGRELEALGVDVVLLDDGFQHRRLARDLDLVLVDATRPFGLAPASDGERAVRSVLPRGLLREPMSGLRRADALIVTRCDQVGERELDALEDELRALAPQAALLRAIHRPARLRAPGGELPLEALRGRAVQLVSGIGNPSAFERTARGLGARVEGAWRFPDHHAFRREELDAARAKGELLVTEKDAPKLAALGVEALVLEVELELVRGKAVLDALLDALPVSCAAHERAALHGGLAG